MNCFQSSGCTLLNGWLYDREKNFSCTVYTITLHIVIHERILGNYIHYFAYVLSLYRPKVKDK